MAGFKDETEENRLCPVCLCSLGAVSHQHIAGGEHLGASERAVLHACSSGVAARNLSQCNNRLNWVPKGVFAIVYISHKINSYERQRLLGSIIAIHFKALDNGGSLPSSPPPLRVLPVVLWCSLHSVCSYKRYCSSRSFQLPQCSSLMFIMLSHLLLYLLFSVSPPLLLTLCCYH